jgi:hypothetical protein
MAEFKMKKYSAAVLARGLAEQIHLEDRKCAESMLVEAGFDLATAASIVAMHVSRLGVVTGAKMDVSDSIQYELQKLCNL